MGIISKTAKVKLWAKNMQYLSKFGYAGNKGDIIDVKIEHLSYRCRSEIEVLCDICGEYKIVKYCDYCRSIENTGSYVCKKCISKKASVTNLKKYGCKSPSQNEVVKETIGEMVDEDSEIISIYYGSDISEEEAEELTAEIEEAYPDCDVELNAGGQPIYYYIISVE